MDKPLFSFHDIETFLAVYEDRSMSKASERLYTSRQSVARSINMLEDVCGHMLFLRTPEGMVPTDFCHEFSKRASALLSDAYALMEFSEKYGRDSDPLSLAILGRYKTGNLVRTAIEAFCQDHPLFHVNISYIGWPEILDAVKSREVDCIFGAILPGFLSDQLRFVELTQSRYVLLSGHEQYGQDPVRAEQLQGKRIVLCTRFNIQVSLLKEYAEAHDLRFGSPLTTADLFLAEEYINKPDYAVILESYHADKLISQNPEYRKATLDPPLIRHSGLIFHKEFTLRNEHKELIAYLRQELAKPA